MLRKLGTIAVWAACLGVIAQSAHGEEGSDAKASPLHPRVKIETSLGDIVLQLDAEKAPISTCNFIDYADAKYYDGTIFHRVISTFMIQGGGFTVEMQKKTEGLRSGIKNEWQNGLKNDRGTISMARTGGNPDSATSQFFINVVDNGNLDRAQRDGAAYAVFGVVVEGMDVVDKIKDTETAAHPKYGGGRQPVVPVETVVIKSVRLISPFDKEKTMAVVNEAEKAEATAKAAEVAAGAEKMKKAMGEWEAAVEKAEKDTGSKAVITDSGLAYIDLTVGDGASPNSTDRVEVHYTGWLVDGTKFDSSVDRGKPSKFRLNGVIKGWTEGVGSMKIGGKRKLIIPYQLAYGERGDGASIPPAATLVFDIELLSIN